MVTRIERGKSAREDPQGITRELIAELPDIEGSYQTPYGQIDLKFVTHNNGHRAVCLGTHNLTSKDLKGPKGEKYIDINQKGQGSVLLPEGVLFVSTDATVNQFKEEVRTSIRSRRRKYEKRMRSTIW